MIVQMLLLRDMCRVSSPQMAPQDVVPIIDKKISQLFNPEATPDIIDSWDQEEPWQSIEEEKSGPDIRKELLWSGVFPSSSKRFDYRASTAAYRIWSLTKTCSILRRRKLDHVALLRQALESAGFYDRYASFDNLFAPVNSERESDGGPVGIWTIRMSRC
jgi:hypothetical protein